MVHKFIKSSDNKIKRILSICSITLMSVVGYYIYLKMVNEIEQYKDEIIQIGPPGATNVFHVFIIVLVCAFVCCIILKFSNRIKGKKHV